MSGDNLTAGTLVRVFETTTRWYLARVRRARPSEVEVEYFGDGARFKVPREQVETLYDFFEQRERVWSVDRTGLTFVFYGRELERLRIERLREMQRVLRKGGIGFEPEDWPSGDTRIRLWRDESVVARDPVDPRLSALLPKWLEPFVLPTGSRDPLGLQAPAERLVNEVLPGLNVFTFRAGYYGFLAWAIRHANALDRTALPRRSSRREVVHALERALVLCEFVFHGSEDNSCSLIGQRSKLRLLGSAEADRFRVPESILKNQSSAGSFRLFTTSLISLRLVEDADELLADGMLPFRPTPLGVALGNAFERRIDQGFTPFAMGERSQPRANLHAWGEALCFSNLAKHARYRTPLLTGLLLGNSREAEKRYATVRHLFAEGLLGGEGSTETNPFDGLSEEEAGALEDELTGTSLSNLDVTLHFYDCPPRDELRPLQTLSVFEGMALGLSCLFRAALVQVTASGKANLQELASNIASSGTQAALWSVPMESAKPRTVRKLMTGIFEADDATEVASLGGLLLLRLIRDPMRQTVWSSLIQHAREPAELVEHHVGAQMHRSLAEVLPGLLTAMVERHEVVSKNKNRQRWLYIEDGILIRDDPQEMGLGLHALRFPQLASLASDMGLEAEDLRRG